MQHVVAIPYPAQGHINPMLQLCRQLVPLGFSFTFINSHHIHQRVQRARPMSPASDAHPDENPCMFNGRDDADAQPACAHPHHPAQVALADDAHQYNGCRSIHMVSVAGGQPPEQHAYLSSWSNVFNAAQEMQEPVEELVAHIMQERGVAFILFDIMFCWCSTTANKFSLPCVGFWPASAATCSMLLHFSDLMAEGKGITVVGEGEAAMVEGIPGLPPTHLDDIPKVWDSGTWKLRHPLLESFAAVKAPNWLLLNTLEEVEGQVLEALRKRLPVMALGPLLLLHSTHPDAEQEPPPLSLFPEDGRCLAWLDTQAASSVLFISFGSISLRTEEQLQELALGVQASGCPFLWVRRPGISTGFIHDDSCPDNADVRPAENGHPQGLMVPWAPQLQVLSHPAVGGFITHCGWNSVMESVSMGVPMLCWADTGERMSNQRFVVEFWKCGMHMVTGRKRVTQNINDGPMLVGRDEVEKSVRFLMLEDGGAPIRARATQLKAVARRAFQGSQSRLKEFVETMEQNRLSMPTCLTSHSR